MATKTVSILPAGVNSHEETAENVGAVATDFISQGIVGAVANTSGVAPATGGFAVNAQGTPNMTVAVTGGVAWVTGTPTAGNSQTFRVKMTSSENVTIASNSTGGTRYDHIYIKLDADKLADPNLAADDVATLVVSRSTSSSSDTGTPPTYGYKLAVVTVANAAATIVNANITDSRTRAGANYVSESATVNSGALYNPYKFYAYHNTTQSRASASVTQFNTEDFDTNNNFSSSRYTAPVNGFYCFSTNLLTNSTPTYATTRLVINGQPTTNARSLASGNGGGAGQDGSTGGTAILQLTAGDYVEIYFYHNAGGNLTVYGDASGVDTTWFSGFLVSTT